MKITGSGKIFNNIKNAAEKFKHYINRRPHEMPKSEEHPFGGWDNRHGLKDFGYKASIFSVGIVFAAWVGVAGVSDIKEAYSIDNNKPHATKIEVEENKIDTENMDKILDRVSEITEENNVQFKNLKNGLK